MTVKAVTISIMATQAPGPRRSRCLTIQTVANKGRALNRVCGSDFLQKFDRISNTGGTGIYLLDVVEQC